MKTTLDLPDALVKQVKLRALQEGRKLKEMVADLLRRGLAADANTNAEPRSPTVTTDDRTGLPLIEYKHAAPEELTPECVDGMLLAQDMRWHHAAGRYLP